ncbi:535f4d22-fd69-4c2e-bb10-eb321dede004 [Sclerotinia trifoliorum]|uniref:535f4d22-fd69-4c2e-bb10-eb321dede004 n=1 Tax=Sclerotinia trifoliorum TaxID=28548 RepID=A0A8H2W2F7_9HELO|nr:535f4d22-fd69-4c2e-bb10-eb321dede004 [Sclerotinia trifoliorum]
MSSSSDTKKENVENGDVSFSDADVAQAFKELQRGEKTAQMLESNLADLEKKIDDLLASFEAQESAAQAEAKNGSSSHKEDRDESGHKKS